MKTAKLLLLAVLLADFGGSDVGPAPRSPMFLASVAAAAQAGHRSIVQLLDIATMGRPADPAGLAWWVNVLAACSAPQDLAGFAAAYPTNPTLRLVADAIVDSQEATLALNPGADGLVDAAYTNLLNRPVTATVRALWVRRIASGEMTRAQAVLSMALAASNTDPAVVASKLGAASRFSAQIDSAQLRPQYRGLLTVGAVRRALAAVGESSDPAAAASAMVEAMTSAITSTVGKPQTIWFAPADTAVRTWADNRNGSDDYMELFAPNAPWERAASRVRIFKMYASVFVLPELPGSLTDDQVRAVLANLKRRNIALAVEHGPLYEDPVSPHCGTGVEGFGGSASLRLAQRIRDLGGELRYLAMDEPFQHARDACGWTAQQVARNAAASIAEIRKVFPNVVVGDIEVVPGSMAMPDWIVQYGQWMDAWREAAGVPLGFFHADINWGLHYGDSIGQARRVARERGIPFGIIYNGWNSDRSDAEWTASAMRNYASAELGREVPEQAIFQSWDHFPERVLPETSGSSFTYLLNSYFRTRTAMSVAAGSGVAHGLLENASGDALPGQPVTVSAQAVDGRGVIGNYILSGTVPTATDRALIQVCINQCGEAGTNDMSVYSFGYFDTGGRITSLGFSDGWNRWVADPAGSATVAIASDTQGLGLQTSASRAQRSFINSLPFSVTPGGRFTLAIRARVSPSSAGSGVFAVIFLKQGELARSTLAFQAASLPLGTATTAADGSYRVSYTVPAGRFAVRANFAGDGRHWPALATTTIGK